MGLDMYLFRKKKEEKFRKYDFFNESREEVAYWRKANQVRRWFIKNTAYPENANCEYHKVTKEQLEQLVSDCKKILEDHSLAYSIMPTKEGFYFGSTEYDEFYFQELSDTADNVTAVLNSTDWEQEEVFYYEWW